MAWACPSCTFLNQGGSAVCGMCALDSPEPVVDSGPEWSCSTCTFLNPFVESSCEMCNTARPELTKLERKTSADQENRSVGKFRPLRSVPDKEALIKQSDPMPRKRKAEADVNEEEEVITEKDMDAGLKGGGVSNSWLGELHLQRMARMNNSMASSGWL